MAPYQFYKPKTLDKKYVLGAEIGKGAYGKVYKGFNLENGDFVAIKQIAHENNVQKDPNTVMEIDLLKNLNHKNIVKYIGSSKTATHLYIIMEYVENGSLANIIKQNKIGSFPESSVAFYIAQVLEGLVYLHEQGIIHRDIKGANILKTKEGLVKLADFGLATKLNEIDFNTHSVVGSAYWMAPEVIDMSGVCAASDIWSVGCTVIELLTRVPPNFDKQPYPALFRISQDDFPPIPESLSSDITDFLLKCFKKDSRQRPDAKTLLSHPWIQNSRRAMQSSFLHSGTIKDVAEFHGKSEVDKNLESEAPNARKYTSGTKQFEKECYIHVDQTSHTFDQKSEDSEIQKAAELSRLVSTLRPDESEDAIVTSCEKLVDMFRERPEQKAIFVTHHGFLPLMDLLDIRKSRVICVVLQLINEIIKDNLDFQENACLVGLIPVVMNFASRERDRSPEIRKEAAYFFHHLCQSSSLTLQMFIACRGIHVLVGFLEADYTKYREMVHLAIDGMWHVLRLKRSTPKNDFYRVAARNGILPKLINTLYSLNEAIRVASTSDVHQTYALHQDGDSPNLSRVVTYASTSDTKDVRKQHRVSLSTNRTSTDKVPEESASNGLPVTQSEKVGPLLSLLEREHPSRHFSGRLYHVKHITGIERQESRVPFSHRPNENKNGGGLDIQISEFAGDVSGRGKENGNLDNAPRNSSRTMTKKVLAHEGITSTRPGSATSSGLLAHMVSTLNVDVAREYLDKVADLLLEFSRADTTVKSYMCSRSLLTRLFQMFNRVEPPLLLKILQCINHLSTDPNCLENLHRVDAIMHLIPNLELKDGNLVYQIHHEVLSAIFNLCKINKRRQEQAARKGIIPHLILIIKSNSPLKRYALPLLCDMAHASEYSREQLRTDGGLDVYLSLLDDESWSVIVLDAIAVCLAKDNDKRKVEQALLKKDAIQKLVNFFKSCPETHIVHILEPFLKILTKSSRINTTLAVNGLTPLLISRLDHQDAIARLHLLKLIKVVYEHHPRPKLLIVANNLPQKLKNLIEERRDGRQRSGDQVLVKQMATSLLKALHFNTIL